MATDEKCQNQNLQSLIKKSTGNVSYGQLEK